MTKMYTSFFTFACISIGSAQVQPLKQSARMNVAVPAASKQLTGFEFPASNFVLKPQPASFYAKAWNESIIGETIYDLMTNGSIQNRNLAHADGTISAGFTFGMLQPGFSDRGTAYNYNNGTVWGAQPTARLETQRTGFPSLLYTTGGNEIVVSHGNTGSFILNKRATKGTGTWTESNIPSNTGQWLLWARAVAGGANGNSLHCIGITAPVANGGTTYQGIDGALLYWRSTDQGATWDVVDSILPGLDSLHFNNFRGDSYSIIAEGDKIAIAIYNQWSDLVLLKSNDNGDTWSSQIVNDFPLDLYIADQPGGSDTNGDMVPDTINTVDQRGSILFDNNGVVHLTVGRMRVLDDPATANTSYFPGTQELLYWNETMGMNNFMILAVPEDVDGDGQLGFAGAFALYGGALCSYPSMGKNTNGTIFVSYSGYREDIFVTDQNYRHVYIIKSIDNGANWSDALDVTPDPFGDYYECMYPTMAPMVDNKVRIMYMRDTEPGIAAGADADAYGVNSIMYLSADTNLINDLGFDELTSFLLETHLFPNPTENEAILHLNLLQTKQIDLGMTNAKGEKMPFSYQAILPEGENEIVIKTNDLASGIYFIHLEIDGNTRNEKLVVKH